MGIADDVGVGLVRGLDVGVGIMGPVGIDGDILVTGEDVEVIAGFVKGLGIGLVVVGEGVGLVAEVGEGLEEVVGLRVEVGEGLGFDVVEVAEDEVFSELSTFCVLGAPTILLLALTHSASTSATISPHAVSESKLKIDEISPSSVLKRSFVGGLFTPLTFAESSDDVGPSCGVRS